MCCRRRSYFPARTFAAVVQTSSGVILAKFDVMPMLRKSFINSHVVGKQCSDQLSRNLGQTLGGRTSQSCGLQKLATRVSFFVLVPGCCWGLHCQAKMLVTFDGTLCRDVETNISESRFGERLRISEFELSVHLYSIL